MKRYIYKLISKYFLSGCSQYNSLSSRRKCRSKQQAKKCFKQLNIPSAKSLLFYNPFSTLFFVKKYGFPVVIKPNIGGFSRGVYFPINNYWQLLSASFLVKIWWHSSIIEQYLAGNNYRIVVLKNDIMAIVRRHPPFVIGNGYDSISTLIDTENLVRQQMGLLPTMANIPKNHPIKQYLRKQQLTLSSIIAKDTQINLHHKIALELGSIVEVIPKEQLTKANCEVLFNITNYFNANILGIDVICEQELNINFSEQKCIFLEVNSRPFLSMHDVPRYGKKEDLSPYYQKLEQYNTNKKDIF